MRKCVKRVLSYQMWQIKFKMFVKMSISKLLKFVFDNHNKSFPWKLVRYGEQLNFYFLVDRVSWS